MLVVAGVFISFALLSSFLIPRLRPRYPGRGLPLFLLATVALFASMFTAVLIFGAEGHESHGEKTGQHK